MARELESRVVELVHEIYGGRIVGTPQWLLRPGKAECGRRWPLVARIYSKLTGMDLPEVMPTREWRTLDAVFEKRGQPSRAFEFDEKQHFNQHRAHTLALYPRSIRVTFPKPAWVERCEMKARLEGGGFGIAKPPLFPDEGGRHRQRAFRDALADILPPSYQWQPTLRIADFEVSQWIWGPEAKKRMRALLAERL